jgi:hypothetical protein
VERYTTLRQMHKVRCLDKILHTLKITILQPLLKGKCLIFFIIVFSVSYNFVKFFELTVDVKVKKTINYQQQYFCSRMMIRCKQIYLYTKRRYANFEYSKKVLSGKHSFLFICFQDPLYVINGTWLRRHPVYSLNYIVVSFFKNMLKRLCT